MASGDTRDSQRFGGKRNPVQVVNRNLNDEDSTDENLWSDSDNDDRTANSDVGSTDNNSDSSESEQANTDENYIPGENESQSGVSDSSDSVSDVSEGRGRKRKRGVSCDRLDSRPERGIFTPSARDMAGEFIRHWENADRRVPNENIIFTGMPGIKCDTDGFSPVQFLELFFNEDLINRIVIQTNLYAQAFIDSNANLPEQSRVRGWVPVTLGELKKFLGLVLLMGLVKLPAVDQYWSKRLLYRIPAFSVVMTRNRFQAISRFLHFNDNSRMPGHGDDNYDRLYKIRPIIDHLDERFQLVYEPRRAVCVDESLLLWKGKLNFRHYIPRKRTRYGIKIYLCCESDNGEPGSGGYCYRMKVYAGKDDPVNKLLPVLPADANQLSVSEQMVVFLIAPLLQKGYIVYMDSWYTSLQLLVYLHGKNTLACGTVRANRDMPRQLSNVQLELGSSRAVIGDQMVMATKYNSTKVVNFLSTAHGHVELTIKDSRHAGITRRPAVADSYNKNMGGVDKCNQLIQPYDCTRKSMKWTKKIFFHFLQLSACNAFILSKKCGYRDRFLAFLEEIITSWSFTDAQPEVVKVPAVVDEEVRLKKKHFCDRIPATKNKIYAQKQCRVCKKKSGMRRLSRFYCPDCPSKPGLCFPDCFKAYHTKVTYWQ